MLTQNRGNGRTAIKSLVSLCLGLLSSRAVAYHTEYMAASERAEYAQGAR